MPPLPDIHFGAVAPDSDELPQVADSEEADEEAPADPALVEILGFDPDSQ